VKHYILEGTESKAPKAVDLITWAQWMETFENRRIALDTIGGITVSTVFLGVDHNFSGEGGPILFESLVTAKYLDEPDSVTEQELETVRYRTYEEAVKGHSALVLQAKATRAIMRIRLENG
jgi:hypothetical protein